MGTVLEATKQGSEQELSELKGATEEMGLGKRQTLRGCEDHPSFKRPLFGGVTVWFSGPTHRSPRKPCARIGGRAPEF